MFCRRTSLAVVILLLLSAPIFAQEDELTRARREVRQDIGGEMSSLPSLGRHDLADVLQFRRENDILLVRTTLSPTNQMYRIEVPDMPGAATLHILPSRLTTTVPAPVGFHFIHRDLERPGTILVQTTVFALPSNLQVTQDIQYLEEQRTVQYVQSGDPGAAEPVKLIVQHVNTVTKAITLDLTMTGTSLTDLRRRYPRATVQYLLPMFRDLHAEAVVFAADAKAAWQVLSEAWKPNPAVAAIVANILPRLDADEFRAREQATQELDRLGQSAALYLMHADRSAWTPEQLARIDSFLAGFRPLPNDEAKRLASDPDFLLDCLTCADAAIRVEAHNRLEATLKKTLPFDLNASDARRFAAVSTLRTQLLAEPSR